MRNDRQHVRNKAITLFEMITQISSLADLVRDTTSGEKKGGSCCRIGRQPVPECLSRCFKRFRFAVNNFSRLRFSTSERPWHFDQGQRCGTTNAYYYFVVRRFAVTRWVVAWMCWVVRALWGCETALLRVRRVWTMWKIVGSKRWRHVPA